MCGIAGFITQKPDHKATQWLGQVSKKMAHRGPDDFGFLRYEPASPKQYLGKKWSDTPYAGVGFLHLRLSILDLSPAGWQPMGTENERYFITFNGEIYNYQELRRELESEGVSFSSSSDTEVLLKGFANWGEGILRKTIGMFAFAILDTHTHSVFLARDFFGIKPLYYGYSNGTFGFCSELTPLFDLFPEKKHHPPRESLPLFALWSLGSGSRNHGKRPIPAPIRAILSAFA